MNKQQQKQPKKVLRIARYKTVFLRPTGVVARCGKSVYICPDYHKKLSRIVCILGEGEITLTDYLHSVLKQHFEDFGEEIAMETLIVICLIIVIILLLKDKVVINKTVRREIKPEKQRTDLPDIMGLPKPVERHTVSTSATKSQSGERDGIADNFDAETYGIGLGLENPQIEREPDEVFGSMSDFENEEDEWDEYGFEDGDNEFATGVTFDELTTVGAWLEQDTLEPALQIKAVDIVQRLQGTELLSLLENSMDGASRKIAELLDKSLSAGTDFSSPDLRKSDLEDFDIGEFV